MDSHFSRIYEEHFHDLFLYAKAICKSEDLAKDAISDVFVNLWKSQKDFRKIKDLRAYLLVSVKNECLKTYYEYLPLQHSNEEVVRVDKISPEDVLLEKELLRVLDKTVDNLPDQCRLIFEMARKQGLSYKEISHELGISTSTVSTQLGRALKAIRFALEEEYGTELCQSYPQIAMTMAMLQFLQFVEV